MYTNFRISNTTIVQDNDTEQKYVSYLINITQDGEDPNPASLERRYTQFSDLYNNLKRDYPSLMTNVIFPKKAMMGNFDRDLISYRSEGFETFLHHVANTSQLLLAPCTIHFFQDMELSGAKQLIHEKRFDRAFTLLEISFTLLNKLYLDRSRVVLVALCRLVACGSSQNAALAGPAERWATLALRRFDAVSDADLLTLYVPLIQACIYIKKTLGKDCTAMEFDLDDMRRRGMKVDACPNLLVAIEQLELQPRDS